jgi:hypothetical protein
MARIPADRTAIISSPSNFLVHVKVLARLFRGKLLAMLTQAHVEGRLTFFTTHAQLADKRAFKRFLAPLRRIKWVVYCKDPFAEPKQVLRYLSCYTRRVAISNRRLGRGGWLGLTPVKDLHLLSFASLPGALCSSTPSFRCPVPLPSAWPSTRRRWPKCGRLPSWTSALGLP